jgi:hypothetical protein
MATIWARGKTVDFLIIVAAAMLALAIPAAAQNGGLPGGHLITDRWRHVYSMYSGITNPAYVNEAKYMSARFLFANTQEAGFTYPLGLYDAVGAAWIMNGVTPFEATDNEGNTLDGPKIVDQGNFVALTYARNVWAGLTVGANLNFIAQNIADIQIGSAAGGADRVSNKYRVGFGADAGLTYKALRHRVYGNHTLGISTNNIFNMIMDTDEKYAAALRFSLLSDFWRRRVYYGADFVLKDILSGDDDWRSSSGPEVGMPWEFTQKIGVSVWRIFKAYAIVCFNNESLDHYGFAFGVNAGRFLGFQDMEAMLQYVSITNPTNAAEANASHITFCVRAEFGKHREEACAR